MRTTTGSVNSNQPKPNSPSYSSSVPLYVYRELAAELKATQDKLDALTAKNQQLAQENQILRHEISQVVQSFLHLQKVVDYKVSGFHPEMEKPTIDPSIQAQPRPQAVRSRQPVVPEAPNSKNRRAEFAVPITQIISPTPDTVLIPEQEMVYQPLSASNAKAKELNSWWLAVCILLIMLSAFGAGYLIVRPLFEHQSR
ncbi:hypothetical protein [Nostoc parmelioides]|uniref:Uncharacterized protein n=1 Tax=Nostoc parmelioides FACHB-3921 TaxID=2692909 RepID=A0ABR8B8H0_9NOSO|nr:hypothetical protein [Nostoc parmelioides]MBD2249809.1 hypothetical protein [Nostoc parmelioides FACHB-3921]